MKVKVPVRVDLCGGWTDVEDFCKYYTGAVVNIAINKYVVGELKREPLLEVKYTSEVPDGSGLGTSAAMNVCLVSLIRPNFPKAKIADLAYQMERSFDIRTGKQDHYASALGGCNYMEFKGNDVYISQLDIPKGLKKRMMLFYTGKSRLSSDIHKKVFSEDKTDILKQLVECAEEMEQILHSIRIDWKDFYKLINRNWNLQIQLHKDICPDFVWNMKSQLRGLAKAFRLTGAGGGGVVQIVCEDNQDKIRKIMKSFGATEIEYDFDTKGIQKENCDNGRI